MIVNRGEAFKNPLFLSICMCVYIQLTPDPGKKGGKKTKGCCFPELILKTPLNRYIIITISTKSVLYKIKKEKIRLSYTHIKKREVSLISPAGRGLHGPL